MPETRTNEELLYNIDKIHKRNYGKTLSNEYCMTQAEFMSIANDLFVYPSFQVSYNKEVNFGDITLTIGY